MKPNPTHPRSAPIPAYVLLLLSLVALALPGCNTAPAAPAGQQAAATPAPVARPVMRPVLEAREYPAEVEAIERVELRPQVGGYLEAVEFREGARVARGQTLFRIDPRPYRAAVAEAEAALAQAEVDAAASRREWERAARLVEKRGLSREEAERRQAAAEAGAARVEAARAALDRARLSLGFTVVRAPIAGRIGRAEVTRGNLVGPETRLAVVVSTDPVYVRFDVDENTLARTASRDVWRVRFALPGSGETFPARIAFVENEIGRGTGTLRVRARLANPTGRVIPGMYGKATLILGETADALLVREAAIGSDQGQRFVLALGQDDVVQYRPVTLGTRVGDLRVVASGVDAGDRIVVNGLFRLRPGAKVAPSEVPMETSATETPAQAGGQEG